MKLDVLYLNPIKLTPGHKYRHAPRNTQLICRCCYRSITILVPLTPSAHLPLSSDPDDFHEVNPQLIEIR